MKTTSGPTPTQSAVLSILFALTLVVPGPPASLAQGLTGRDLAPANDAQAGLGELLGRLADGQLATIGRATVLEDGDNRLVLRLSCTTCADRRLQVELRDRGRQRLPHMTVASKAIEGGFELTLALDPSLPEGSQAEAAQLQVRLLNPQLGLPEAEARFQLPKTWHLPVKPENQVVRIAAVPIGAAARLPANPVGVTLPPPRALRVEPNLLLQLKATNLSTAQAVEGPRAGEGSTSSPLKTGKNLALSPATAQLRVGLDSASRDGATAAPTPSADSPVGTLARIDKNSLAAALRSNQVLAAQTAPAAQALKINPNLIRAEAFQFGVKPQDRDRGARGPGSRRLWLFEGLRSDVDIDQKEVVNVWPEVFADANEASGVFYFLPQAYHLEWTADDGYALKMLYGAATSEGQAGEVLMAARLDAGVDLREIETVRALLEAYRGRHPGTPFTELRPLPIAQPPAISLSGGLATQFEIPPEKIALNALSDALGEVDISWATDAVTKENIQLALVADAGLNGSLTYVGAGESLTAQIPVEIRLATPGTFGTWRWSRMAELRNDRPYPVRLKHLRALSLVDNQPVIYSWNLGDATVPPLARIEIDASRIPGWLDQGPSAAKRWWISYAVKADCETCDRAVITSITRGVASLTTAQIVFRVLRPLADLDAAEIVLQVRSRYFDPNVREWIVKRDLVIGEDDREYTVGPIYVGSAPEGEPLFEYQLSVTYADGSQRDSGSWLPGTGLRMPLGRKQVEAAIGQTGGQP